MKIVGFLEWLVLLPLWRRLIKSPGGRIAAATGTGIVWIIIVVIAATSGGGDDGDGAIVAEVEGTPTPTIAPIETALPTPELTATPTPELTPEPTPSPTSTPTVVVTPESERIVPAEPGAIAVAQDIRVTLNEIMDPWVDTTEFFSDEPAPGKRFVAFDVTLENVADSGTHFAFSGNFKLTDIDGFVANEGFVINLEPHLFGADLGSGEKTRGWIVFEVNEGAALDILKYDPDIFTTDDIEFQF